MPISARLFVHFFKLLYFYKRHKNRSFYGTVSALRFIMKDNPRTGKPRKF